MTQDVEHAAPDDLVTLLTRASSFEGHATVALLAEHEVPAWVFDSFDQDGVPLSHGRVGVPVQVRRADLARARAVLESADELGDVDWSDVDVGEREDDLPLRTPGRMPAAARVAFLIAVLVVLASVIGAAVILLGP